MILVKSIRRCNHPLSGGRLCCHVQGHDGRHSHTWQQGDARYLDTDDKIIDTETGEVVGYCGDLADEAIAEIIAGRGAFHRKPELDPERQAKARRVLEVQYGATFFDDITPARAKPPAGNGYRWHYEGAMKAIGTDGNGHDIEFDFASGKVQRIYSASQRRQVVDYARRLGATSASRKFDIPVETIRTWAKRSK
jgi:hypothetical protein